MKRIFFIVFIVLFVNNLFSQPLGGTYTINNTQVTTTPMVDGGNFHTFSDAVNYLNLNGISASVIFNIISSQVFTEDVPAITATGTATNTITFQKYGSGVNVIISATGTAGITDAGITINGGNYFIFDGIDVNISNGSALEFGYYLKNVSATDGAQYNVIKNCKIILNRINTTSRGIYQNVANTPTNIAGANSNNSYQYIVIENSYHGIQCVGNAAFPDSNTIVSHCVIGANLNDDIGNGTSPVNGIRLSSQKDYSITYNTVRNITCNGGANGKLYGVFVESAQGNKSKIAYNNIYNIKSTSTNTGAVLYGIRADINSSNSCDIYNNMIYGFSHGITTANATMVCRALSVGVIGTGTGNISFNSVNINMGSAATSTACYIGGGTANVIDNIFANISLGEATSKRYALYINGGTFTSNYNNLYVISSTNNFLGYNTTDQAVLSNWQTSAGTPDLNSINTDPIFVSSTDLHTLNPLLNGVGIPVAGITTDIDGDIRNVTNPDVGADEFLLAPCNEPSNIVLSSSTHVSATIDWTVNGTETSWNIQYGATGFTLGSGIIANITAHPAIISTLVPSTSYDVYVQAFCGINNTSAWVGPFNFITQSNPLLIWAGSPFIEDVSNNGNIGNTVQLTLTSETFIVSSGLLTSSNHYNISNLPADLIEQINVISSTTAVISLTGQATNHTNAYDVNNVGVTFLNAAFTGNNASIVLGSSKTDLAINFIDPYSNATNILTYSFAEQTNDANIDNNNHTVVIEVNSTTSVTNLIAVFALSTGATATVLGTPQVSGTTPNNFTSIVTYVITAEDGITSQNWTVTVTVEPVIESIVEWTFPTASADAIADSGISANLTKTITTNSTGTVTYPTASGTTTNTIRSTGWDNGMNTDYWEIELTTSGYKNITLSSKQRSSSTGPRDFKAQYKINFGTWADVGGTTITVGNDFTSGVITDIILPEACNNQASLYVRWIMTSNISVSGDTVTGVGASNMDDIFVKGILITNNNEVEIYNPFDFTVYPNPIVNEANVSFTLAKTNHVEINVVNALGQIVLSEDLKMLDSGEYVYDIDATKLISGIYFLNVKVDENTITKRISVLK